MKTATLAFVLVFLSCGGSRTGDEGLFGGDPLPPPEPDASSATPRGTSTPGAPCTEPAGGFPVCTPDGANSPCVVQGAACFLQCERCASHPCPAARLVPWKCATPAPAPTDGAPPAASSAPTSTPGGEPPAAPPAP